MIKRIITLLMACVMLLTLFVGCSSNASEETNNEISSEESLESITEQNKDENYTKEMEETTKPETLENSTNNDNNTTNSNPNNNTSKNTKPTLPSNGTTNGNTTSSKPNNNNSSGSNSSSGNSNSSGNNSSSGNSNSSGNNSSSGNSNNSGNNSSSGTSTTPNTGTNVEDKVIFPSGGMDIEQPKTLPQSYIYPSYDIMNFTVNSTGIYENEYVKLDTTKAEEGYLIVKYKEQYATQIKLSLEHTHAYTNRFVARYHDIYQKEEFSYGKELVMKLPCEEGKYYFSVSSTVNGISSVKLQINLGLVTANNIVSLEHVIPSAERIKLTEVSKGIYENVYVRINTNTSPNGYIEIESLDSNTLGMDVYLYSDKGTSAKPNSGPWQYRCENTGKFKIKAALCYGPANYELIIRTTLTSTGTQMTRNAEKARITLSFNNVSETGPFLLSTGEVIYNSNMQFIKKANEIAATCKDDFEKVAKIYDWLTNYLEYGVSDDYTAVGLYTCELDRIYYRGYGVCYDYAVIFAAMLRSQGIPCKVMFGRRADESIGHAWNEVYIATNGSIKTDKIFVSGNKWCILDPTLSCNGTSPAEIEYMKNPSNYVAESIY